jgi:hypothetical protein
MKRILALLVIWPALASAQTYNYQITSGSFIVLTGVLTFAGNGFTGGGFSPGMSTFGPLSLDGWTGSLSSLLLRAAGNMRNLHQLRRKYGRPQIL